jgi:RNA polymerase sigma-70 factor (ECF subfamily)
MVWRVLDIVNTQKHTLTGTRTMMARRTVRESVAGGAVNRSTTATEREAAFKRLAEDHLEESYRLANAILGDPSESRDAVHDAFVRGWQQFPTLRDSSRFEWWFKRIVVNTCRNRLRDARQRRASDIATQTAIATPDHASRSHDRVLLEQAIAGLTPDDRIVLALRYYHDLKLDRVAELLDVPTGTVKSRLSKAHQRLRAEMERQQPQEEAR